MAEHSQRYKAYPEYKDSGVEWLGEIPEHWKILRGKYVFQEFRERSTTGEEELLSVSEYYGVKPRSEKISEGDYLSRAESLVDYKKCYKNDLVMNIMLAWKRGLGVSNYDGIVSPAYSVFRFNRGIHPYYMHHLFRTDLYTSHFKTRSTGVIDSRLRLYPESFLDTEILIPSYAEQNQIANFLDHETAKIDTLIEKQQRLIELLTEKRQAVISHAVTKGLKPDVPMKDSGVEWLGEVPVHWEVSRIKYITSVFEQGWSPQCDSRPAESNEYGVLKVGCVNYGSFHSIENKALPPELQPRLQYLIEKGDLLISRANTKELVGSAAVVDKDYNNLLLCDKLYRLRFNPNIQPELIALYLSIEPVREQIELQASGASSSMQNISQDVIKELPCFLLPNEEAYELLNYLNEKMNIFDNLIEKAEQAIQLMQERRIALISAAVTGKIDVRGWVGPVKS